MGALDSSFVRQLQRAHPVQVAILNDWDDTVPTEWSCVGAWRTSTLQYTRYFFFAMSDSDASELRHRLEVFDRGGRRDVDCAEAQD